MIDEDTIEEIKAGLTTYVNQITEPDRRAGHNMYKCPLCGSGQKSGRHDGAFSITKDGKAWKCFSCGQGGDIFTLISLHEGITDFPEQVKRGAEVTGVNLYSEFLDQGKGRAVTAADFDDDGAEAAPPKKEEKAPVIGRFKGYIDACAADVGKTDYFKRRGFTEDTVKRFHLGYDIAKQSIVIPYGKTGSYYMTRNLKAKDAGRQFRKPKADLAGTEPVYNVGALYEKKPCFVCEGPLDAISIMQAGGGTCNAVALGGTGSQKLIEKVKAKAPACMLILNFDGDDEGEKAATTAAADLQAAGVAFIKAAYSLDRYPEDKPHKDANDLLRASTVQLAADIAANIERAETAANAEKAAALEAHNAHNGAVLLRAFENGITEAAQTTYLPTGFSELDRELDGGLYPGLYILGAISSLGKTTLLLQIADQIAAQGKDVLYFSLEMAATELISKSISRHTYRLCDGHTENAKTARGITTVSRYANYSQEEKDLIKAATEAYGEYAGRLYIYEGVGDIGVGDIRKRAEEHKRLTGRTPVIFLDYLQILAPYDMRASDKQNTDKAVLELKRLSRDFKTAVIAISSFNRDNYTSEVNMAAFKESGAIEYGSDVLLALQPQGMKAGYTKTDQKYNADLVKKCKRSTERSIEALILKNRNGRTGGRVGFTYYALFNYFAQDYGFTEADDVENPFLEDEGAEESGFTPAGLE